VISGPSVLAGALTRGAGGDRMALVSKCVIGILGGIGSGKSTVAAELAALGCAVVDADAIGHELLGDPEIQAELRRLWGDAAFRADGQVDRPAVAAKVFGSPAELARLNEVMHPRMRHRLAGEIARLGAAAGTPAVVLDAAVLLEAGWDDLCTHLVFVDAPAGRRSDRVQAGRGWDADVWRRREKSQKPLDIKRARAEYVLDNSSSLASLREQVRSLLQTVLQSADRLKDHP